MIHLSRSGKARKCIDLFELWQNDAVFTFHIPHCWHYRIFLPGGAGVAGIVIGLIVGLLILVVIIVAIVCVLRGRRSKQPKGMSKYHNDRDTLNLLHWWFTSLKMWTTLCHSHLLL